MQADVRQVILREAPMTMTGEYIEGHFIQHWLMRIDKLFFKKRGSCCQVSYVVR